MHTYDDRRLVVDERRYLEPGDYLGRVAKDRQGRAGYQERVAESCSLGKCGLELRSVSQSTYQKKGKHRPRRSWIRIPAVAGLA